MLPLPFILERVRYLHGYKEYGDLANSSIVWKASALVEQVRQLVIPGDPNPSSGCCTGCCDMGRMAFCPFYDQE